MSLVNTLYKLDSKGKVRLIEFHVEGDSYWFVTGLMDGKKTTSSKTVAVGKNIGRSNETSPSEQALLELYAKCRKKFDEGYRESVGEAQLVDKPFFPMLAVSYDVDRDYFPCFIQPKLDGIRCVIYEDKSGNVVAGTRRGKPFGPGIVDHIIDRVKPFFKACPGGVLDGELYYHGDEVSFQDLVSIIRKKKPNAEQIEQAKKYVQYHVYDGVIPGSDSFLARFDQIHYWISENPCNEVKSVNRHYCKTFDEFKHFNDRHIKQGFEGSMLRTGECLYQTDKRSKELVKVKEFLDREYIVKDILPGRGNKAGKAGRIVYEVGDGREFKSGLRGSHEYCKEILENKDQYIGKSGTVMFFEYTDAGIPRFPVTTQLSREDYEGYIEL